jgi:WD40 repeat protein
VRRLQVFLFVALLLLTLQGTFAQEESTSYRFWWNKEVSRILVLSDTTLTVYDSQWQLLATRQTQHFSLSPSPDMSAIVVRNDTGWEVWDGNTLQTLRMLPIDNRAASAQWNSDGTQFALRDIGTPGVGIMGIYRFADGSLLRQFTNSNSVFWALPYEVFWSPNGMYFATAADNQLVLLDAVTGMQIGDIYQAQGSINTLQWSSDSSRIALSITQRVESGNSSTGNLSEAEYLHSIEVINIATNSVMSTVSGFENWSFNLAWSPDDTQLATIVSGILYIVDPNTGAFVDSFVLNQLSAVEIGYTESGGRLFVGYSALPFEDTIQRSVDANLDIPISTFNQSQFNGMVQIFSPAASPERLEAITAACGLPARTEAALNQQAVTDLTAFTEQVAALPDTQIPPGCRADLLAVAAALQAE